MDPITCLFSLTCFVGPEAGALGGPLATAPKAATEVVEAQAPAAEDAYKPKASEVLTLVQAFYDGTQDLQAKFKQTYYNPSYGSKTITKGDLKLLKPGKMIWDYKDKADPDFYADGKMLWVIEHDTRQVVSKQVSKNADVAAAMKFLFGGQKLVRDFKVRYASDKRTKRYGSADHYVLELKPRKKNPHYKGLVLVVHNTTGRVDQFVVYNQDNSTNHFSLGNVRTNKGIDGKQFEFKVPKGYVESKE